MSDLITPEEYRLLRCKVEREKHKVIVDALLAQSRIPMPVCEHRFCSRKFRFDYAWPEQKVAVEIEGGTYGRRKARHSTGSGYSADCDKYNLAALGGWLVLRYTAAHVRRHKAQILAQVAAALELRAGGTK